jgi:transcriptional regulator with XRE-family HTH domain
MKLSKLDISKYLQDLRKENGKTLREVAAYLEIDQAILSKMENGKRPVTKDVLTQLAKLYKKDIQERDICSQRHCISFRNVVKS